MIFIYLCIYIYIYIWTPLAIFIWKAKGNNSALGTNSFETPNSGVESARCLLQSLQDCTQGGGHVEPCGTFPLRTAPEAPSHQATKPPVSGKLNVGIAGVSSACGEHLTSLACLMRITIRGLRQQQALEQDGTLIASTLKLMQFVERRR